MSHPQAGDLTFVPVYIVFGILFIIGVIVIILVSIAHCPDKCCRCLKFWKTQEQKYGQCLSVQYRRYMQYLLQQCSGFRLRRNRPRGILRLTRCS